MTSAAPYTLGRLLRLAGPISLAQIAFLGMHTTDTVMAGRVSAEVLAAISIGNALLMLGFVAMLGFCLAISPGVAQRSGAGATADEMAAFAGSSLWFSVVLWTLWGLVIWFGAPRAMPLVGLEPLVEAEALAYMRAVALGTPGVGVFFGLRNLIEGLGHSRPVMWLGLGALALNAVLDYWFIFGIGPLPPMGAMGCGLATALVDVGLGLGAWLIVRRDRRFARYAPRLQPPRRRDLRELFAVGTPLAGAMFFEHGIFAAGGVLMARFGTAAVGAHAVALNLIALAFMIPIGLGQATAVLVGQAAGARDAMGVRRAAVLGFGSAASFAILLILPIVAVPGWLVSFYTQEVEVILLAATLLQIGGAFHLFDALQALGAGALRGLKDTTAVLLITATSYWLIGLPMFWWLAFGIGLGPTGIWWAFTISLAVAATLLGLRFHLVTRRMFA